MSDFEAIARWWIGLSVVSIAMLPLVWWLFDGFSFARQVFVRPVSIVLVTAVVWWPCAVFGIPFRGITIWVFVLALAALTWGCVLRMGLLDFSRLRAAAGIEVLWTLLFLGYLWFRSGNAAIRDTEKPMEIALLSSISISHAVPAPDPWLAGHAINYYYLGYQWVATIANLIDVPPAYAFNLALATIFASLATMVAGIGYAIARRTLDSRWLSLVVGTLAAMFVVVAGNLETAIQLIRQPGETIDANWWSGIGWSASRVIMDTESPGASETINEFPAFSLILGDLHPHVLTALLLVAVVGMAVGFLLKPKTMTRARLMLAGVMIGLLYASNSWDAPLGLALIVGAYLLSSWPLERRRAGIDGATLLGSSIVAVLPFVVQFNPPVGDAASRSTINVPIVGRLFESIGIVTWHPSSAGELLTVHGVWIALFVIFAATTIQRFPDLYRRLKRGRVEIIIPVVVVLLAIAIVWMPAIVVIGIPLAVALLIAIRAPDTAYRVIGALFVVGFALVLIPEFFYIRDAFGNRMNTVFKLYFQAWFVLAIASATGISVLASKASRWRSALLVGTAAIALLLTLPYTVLSIPDWRNYETGSATLDGLAYIERSNPDAAAAISWLASNAGDDDVLVEVPGCAYGTAYGVPWNRFSAYTGVPALLGWENHERQWRRGDPDLESLISSARQSSISWLQGEPSRTPQTVIPRFVIFGPQEVSGSSGCAHAPGFGDTGVAKLGNLGWSVAFQSGQIRILTHQNDPILRSKD